MMDLRTDRYKLKEIFPEKAKSYAQKLKVKAGELEFVRKGIPIDPKDIEIKEGERAAIRLVTTPHLDRDSEILIPGGAVLDDFRQSPSVLYAHDYRGLPIGSDQWIKQVKEGILAKTVYAKHQFAEDVYQCVKDRHLNTNSVGFIPVDSVEPDDSKHFEQTQEVLEKDYGINREESGKAKRIYTKWIMLEHSDVPVPSNAQSLNLAVSKGELVIQSERLRKDLEIEVVKDGGDREIEIVKAGPESRSEPVKGGSEPGLEPVKSGSDLVTKPETTENYHRIPVSEGHDGHRIRTITISADQGIKALYCGECKVVVTYLFDVDKWTMAEAQAWIKEHKDFEAQEETDMEEGKDTQREKSNGQITTLGLVAVMQELTCQAAELTTAMYASIAELRRTKASKMPEEREIVIEKNGHGDSLDDKITNAVEKLFAEDKLGKMINDAIKEILDITLKKKLGKVA